MTYINKDNVTVNGKNEFTVSVLNFLSEITPVPILDSWICHLSRFEVSPIQSILVITITPKGSPLSISEFYKDYIYRRCSVYLTQAAKKVANPQGKFLLKYKNEKVDETQA